MFYRSLAISFVWCVFPSTISSANDRNLLAETDVASDGALLIVPVESNGHLRNYWVDTGVSNTIVPLETVKSWKPIRMENGRGIVQSEKISVFERPDAEEFLGQMLRRRVELYSMDLREISEATGVNIEGVLGMGDLKRFVIQIDFDEGKFRLLRSASEANGEIFPLGTERGCPTIKVVAGKTTFDAVVDTGASGDLFLTSQLFDLMVEKNEIKRGTDTEVVATLGGASKIPRGTLRNIGSTRLLRSGDIVAHPASVNFVW